jgi:hypothetical protein
LQSQILLTGITTSSFANPIVVSHDFGIVNLACASEGAACAPDILPGPRQQSATCSRTSSTAATARWFDVVWDFTFDASPFLSIASMTMQVDVVGFLGAYPGNIGPAGQLGNFFAIDGVPIFPFLVNTDGRDSHVFAIPTLAAGSHQFSVQAYDPAFSPGGNFEGWGGVDFARLTVSGETAAAGCSSGTRVAAASGFRHRGHRPRSIPENTEIVRTFRPPESPVPAWENPCHRNAGGRDRKIDVSRHVGGELAGCPIAEVVDHSAIAEVRRAGRVQILVHLDQLVA